MMKAFGKAFKGEGAKPLCRGDLVAGLAAGIAFGDDPAGAAATQLSSANGRAWDEKKVDLLVSLIW